MSRLRVTAHDASFPSDYEPPAFFAVLFRLATLSRAIRDFFFRLPPSRPRVWAVANYYRSLTQQFEAADFGFLRAVHDDAEITLFSLDTFRGKDGWRSALMAWRDSFAGGPTFELREFVTAPRGADRRRGSVVLALRTGGRGGASGAIVEAMAYFVITVDHGMAVHGHVYRDEVEALEAVGLRT